MREKKGNAEFLIPPDSPLWDGLGAATMDLISLKDLERHLDRFEDWLDKANP